ncbi:MAG: hypothetical protein EOO88_21430 [Pedobacter sp.]|nr:MAG: hypothetical protein EOO88_21430 [Pedobacter sp.]
MGILENGILGGVRNKVGPAIGKKFRGMDLVVGPYRESNKPEKPGEIRQQNKFGMLNYFLDYVREVVDVGFKQYARKHTAVNAAHSHNFAHAFIEEGDELKLNFPKLALSRGNVAIPNCPSVALTAANMLTFSWLPEAENQNTRRNDRASFVVWQVIENKPLVLVNTVVRSDLQFSLEIKGDLQGETLHCYMNFTNDSGKLVGNSIYVGAVEIV